MTPRYKLRTLLLLLAILPPLLWIGWGKYAAWKAEQVAREQLRDWLVTAGRGLLTTDVPEQGSVPGGPRE